MHLGVDVLEVHVGNAVVVAGHVGIGVAAAVGVVTGVQDLAQLRIGGQFEEPVHVLFGADVGFGVGMEVSLEREVLAQRPGQFDNPFDQQLEPDLVELGFVDQAPGFLFAVKAFDEDDGLRAGGRQEFGQLEAFLADRVLLIIEQVVAHDSAAAN